MTAKKVPARTPRPPRPARSKETLQTELEKVQSALTSKEELDPITARDEAARKAELAKELGTITAKSVTEKLGQVGLEVQSSLDAVRTTLIASTQELEELREVIAIESERLEVLHGKDVILTSRAAMLEEYEAKSKELQQGQQDVADAFNQKMADARKAETERKLLAEKERAREEEEHQYERDKSRRDETDEFNQQMLRSQREFDEQLRTQEKNWALREEELKKQEAHTADMTAQVAGFEEKLKKEKEKAVAIATAAQSKEHKHEMAMVKQQAAADKALLERSLENMAEQVASLNNTNATLNNKLAAAENRVESIAKSAMERDSGKAALDAQQKTIETMQPTTTGGKR